MKHKSEKSTEKYRKCPKCSNYIIGPQYIIMLSFVRESVCVCGGDTKIYQDSILVSK